MITAKDTPGRIKGYGFSEVVDCNWAKAWSVEYSKERFGDDAPFLIQLPNGALWVVPNQRSPSQWGLADQMPPLDTSTFTGPFDDFELAFTTFVLMASAYL